MRLCVERYIARFKMGHLNLPNFFQIITNASCDPILPNITSFYPFQAPYFSFLIVFFNNINGFTEMKIVKDGIVTK